MEETGRAKAEWRCAEPTYPSELSTLTSPPCVHHPESSLNTSAYGFLLKSVNSSLITKKLEKSISREKIYINRPGTGGSSAH